MKQPLKKNITDGFVEAAAHVPPIPGYFDVAFHSDGTHISFATAVDAKNEAIKFGQSSMGELEKLLVQSGWDGKTPLRVIACHAAGSFGKKKQMSHKKLQIVSGSKYWHQQML